MLLVGDTRCMHKYNNIIIISNIIFYNRALTSLSLSPNPLSSTQSSHALLQKGTENCKTGILAGISNWWMGIRIGNLRYQRQTTAAPPLGCFGAFGCALAGFKIWKNAKIFPFEAPYRVLISWLYDYFVLNPYSQRCPCTRNPRPHKHDNQPKPRSIKIRLTHPFKI